ncbi:MAG: universal stress protein [Proteobacteria bacterium]|uniref:universal stress protein n=1 Tax=Rudaea sp. TaxID=2136325 RepID=UPI0032209388|nr:universal stress protein [Pseudomonadota bacterium]
MKVLLSYDGSDCSDRAAKFVTTTLRKQLSSLKLDVIYIDTPMPDRAAATLGEETVARLRRENADFVLKGLRARLKRAALPFTEVVATGPVAKKIGEHAEKGGYDLVVMGSHGRSAAGNLFLGSVATRVLAECKIPVLIVR